MKNPFKKNTAEHFFWQWAGWSHPTGASETGKRKARAECARALAKAEREASERGYRFGWQQDYITDEDFRDTDAPYYLWAGYCRDSENRIVASLGGVDFGPPPGDPWDGNTYRRVVEAELAYETLAEVKS